MNKLEIIEQNLIRLSNPKEIEGLVVDEMDEKAEEIIKINQAQLLDGIRADGKKTKTYKTDRYVTKHKQGSKSLPNRDYKLTGDMYNAMDAAPRNESLLIFSLDEKASFLEAEEDGQLFGAAPLSRPQIKKLILPGTLNRFKNEVFRGT